MNRSSFGAWGSDLSDREFAEALAALGVLEWNLRQDSNAVIQQQLDEAFSRATRSLISWTVSPTVMPFISETPAFSARDLAEGWAHSSLPGRARLEVDRSAQFGPGIDSQAILPWIVTQLGHPDVKARSVFLRVDRPTVEVGWSWPLRVGFLDDPRSRALKERLQPVLDNEKWMQPLVNMVDAERAHGACDLLLIPGHIRAALSIGAGLRNPVRADCTLVLGHPQGEGANWYRMVEGLRATLYTSGVAITMVSPNRPRDWFIATIAALSHNNPIDIALFEAARKVGTKMPFISAARSLVEFSRLSAQMRRMAGRFRAASVRALNVAITSSSAAERTLGVSPGMYSLDEVGERLETMSAMADDQEDAEDFMHETGAATGAAELATAAADATSAAPEPRQQARAEDRFIQARVFDATDAGAIRRRRHSFRADAPNRVVVRIGALDSDWISGDIKRPVPVHLLPQDQDRYHLKVVLSIVQTSDAPQISPIELPRFGNSTEAHFVLFPRKQWERVEARITVLHQNRVLQTAMLEGEIGADADTSKNGSITVEPEVVVRNRFDALGTRQDFGAALVLNHTNDAVASVMAVADDKVARFTPSPTMLNALNDIDALLTQVAQYPKDFAGDINSEPVVDLLRKFARHGNLLYDHIVRDGGLADAGLVGDAPLQVISAVADARLPIELIYSRKAPTPTAVLCPQAAESLRKGKCEGPCNEPEHEKDFICPLGFWGVQRVIERHAHNSELAKYAGGGFAVLSEPTEFKNTLDLFRGGLVAGSQRVEKTVVGGLMDICDHLGKLTNMKLVPIPTWQKWSESIAQSGPSLLVLIVHTEARPEIKMEIGDDWLASADLEREHVLREGEGPPLVLLLGCETGVPDKQFANFVNRIRNRGAAIVVATGAKIHSLHAVPVAKEFIDRIQEILGREGSTFGEVMLTVRREMLAEGMPMVLTLTAFGDADWQLTKHT